MTLGHRGSILIRATPILLLSLFFYDYLLAKEKPGAGGRIVASTFKTLAKAFVATADVGKLKQENIRKIDNMDEAKFRKQYAKVYVVIKELPPQLKLDYGVSEKMTKEQVVNDIKSLNKASIYKLIDGIPDAFIVSEFKRHLINSKQKIQRKNLANQVGKIWNKMIAKTKNSES